MSNLTKSMDDILRSVYDPATGSLKISTSGGGTAVPAKTLYINGVGIDTINYTSQSGGTAPVTWLTNLAFGHNAVTLANAESTTTKAPRRVPLFVSYMPATSPIGTVAICQNSWKTFQTPIVVQPGEYVQVVQRFIGTLHTTANQTQMHHVSYDGYFE